MSIDFITFLAVAIIISVIVGFTYYFSKRRAELKEKGPLVYKEPNTTNYNLDKMDREDLKGLSKAEAEEVLRKEQDSENILSRNDYEQLKKAID